MKIRITGTKAECELAQEYYKEYVQSNDCVKDYNISRLYANNRENSNLYRVYIDINYILEPTGGSNGMCYNIQFLINVYMLQKIKEYFENDGGKNE